MLRRFLESTFKRVKGKSSTPDELHRLLDEIKRLTDPSDMPNRIELCRAALALVDRDTQPEQWAWLQHELGVSLWNNPLGNRADNLEQAIFFYEQALEILDVPPLEWASTMNNLADAYWKRIKGERAENIEQAISFYEQALEVYTRQVFPEKWPSTMNKLAAAYWKRIKGERTDAERIEQVISFRHFASFLQNMEESIRRIIARQ